MAINPFLFFRTPAIHFGARSSESIGAIVSAFGNTALWVHGTKSLADSGGYTAIAGSLRAAGVAFYEWEIAGEPSPDEVDKAVDVNRSRGISAVLSVGGGSAIDAGKAISAMLTVGGPTADYLEDVGGKMHPGTKVPFVAVPTTAGTGCEATKNAVLSRPGPKGFKKSLRHDNFVPDAAVIDPALAQSCPRQVTAACGLDALTQLLESFVSVKASILTDMLAESGMERIKDSLLSACDSGSADINIRSNLAWAALMSGITLANAGLGAVHGFASSIGGMFGAPHGAICGSLLAPTVSRTVDKLGGSVDGLPHLIKFAQAGEILCGMRGDTAEETCDMLVRKLEEYARRLSIPRLRSYGITASSISAIIDGTNIKNHPVKLDKDDLRKILMECI